MYRIYSLLLVLLGAGSLACIPAVNKAYHPVPDSVEKKSDDHPYELAYIEFDEQGEPWDDPAKPDDGQLDRAIEMIDRVNGSRGDERGDPDGAIFVTYIHGWRNNAAPDNPNLLSFKEMLGLLQRDEERMATAEARPPRPVAGIYIAWRGDSLTTPKTALLRWLDVFTFWNRNTTALRIASRPPATQSLLILMKEIQGNPHARSIVVGHSMGALILERAVSQAFVGMVNEVKYRPACPTPSDPPERTDGDEAQCPKCACPEELQPGKFKPPADLIVFVNSAASAIQAKHLVEVLQDESVMSISDRGETPFLISVTAENDRATKVLFPIGLSLTTGGQRFRREKDLDQRALITHTPGHSPSLYDHEMLSYRKNASCEGSNRSMPLGIFRCHEEERGPFRFVFTIDGEEENGTKVRRRFALRRKEAAKDSPYWIFQVPSDVIDGHSAFFRNVFFDFLRGVITVTDAIDPEKQQVYSAEIENAADN